MADRTLTPVGETEPVTNRGIRLPPTKTDPPASSGGGSILQTSYVILQKTDLPDGWLVVATIDAGSAEAAVKRHLMGALVNGETFVAVPSRSWRPVKTRIQTTTSVQLVVEGS